MKLSVICEEEIEYEEPFGSFSYNGEKYPYWGNPAGRNKTVEYDTGKFNKFAKIGVIADELIHKFENNVKSDYKSVIGRCSFAAVLMMKYGIRIGNEDSASGYESGLKDNEGEVVQTFGTTTMLNKHVNFNENGVALDFLGKTQVKQHIVINDEFIVAGARRYYRPDLPDVKWLGIDYNLLFDFVKTEVGDGFIPKDFRTFCANITAWNTVKSFLSKPKRETKTEVNQEIKSIVESVAAKLGNTPSISKRNYIDNRMLDWFKGKRLVQ